MSDAVSELRSLARNLRTMGVGTHLTRPIATRLSSLTIRSYRAQEAPDGSNWAAGKYASRPMLQKSRALIGSLTPTVGTAKVGLKFGTKYGWYHQHGAQLRGRKPSGPMQRRTRSGPVRAGERRSVYQQRRQGAERGRLPRRQILPSEGSMPMRWERPTESLIDRYVRSKIAGS